MTDATRVNRRFRRSEGGGKKKLNYELRSKSRNRLRFRSVSALVKSRRRKTKIGRWAGDEIVGADGEGNRKRSTTTKTVTIIISRYCISTRSGTLDDYYKHRARRVSERLRHDDCRPTVFIRVI